MYLHRTGLVQIFQSLFDCMQCVSVHEKWTADFSLYIMCAGAAALKLFCHSSAYGDARRVLHQGCYSRGVTKMRVLLYYKGVTSRVIKFKSCQKCWCGVCRKTTHQFIWRFRPPRPPRPPQDPLNTPKNTPNAPKCPPPSYPP